MSRKRRWSCEKALASRAWAGRSVSWLVAARRPPARQPARQQPASSPASPPASTDTGQAPQGDPAAVAGRSWALCAMCDMRLPHHASAFTSPRPPTWPALLGYVHVHVHAAYTMPTHAHPALHARPFGPPRPATRPSAAYHPPAHSTAAPCSLASSTPHKLHARLLCAPHCLVLHSPWRRPDMGGYLKQSCKHKTRHTLHMTTRQLTDSIQDSSFPPAPIRPFVHSCHAPSRPREQCCTKNP